MFDTLPAWFPPLLAELLSNGGVVVALLLVMAVLVIVIFLLKLWQLRRSGVLGGRALRRVNMLLDGESTYSIPPEVAAMPAMDLAGNLLELLRANRLSSDALTSEASRQLQHYQRQLMQYLPTMELIATLAPSLGLLGTVLGMIEAFQAMEAAGRDVEPAVLSGGIWQALLTTAAGLAVAIPTIILANWLGRCVDSHLAELDDRLTRLLNFVVPDDAAAGAGAEAVAAGPMALLAPLEEETLPEEDAFDDTIEFIPLSQQEQQPD
ncbi:MAG: flagellar motor protein MotA [Gammaproteobacteria bacterium]|nr:MAG: flagellar motor protein MotA [Gammaproteobacteria bacterium]PIE36457.1 MAG: flagellar motor protein MotA [Gammaproteobacteria bacterium]